MTNQKLRQAWQAAHRHRADHEDGGRRASSEFYRMDSSLIHQEMRRLAHQDAGAALERAQQGEGQAAPPGGGLQGRADPLHDHPGVQVDVRLRPRHRSSSSRTSGFNIDLQVVDWATLVKRRNNPKEYDVFTTGIGRPATTRPTPTYLTLQLAGLDLRRGDPDASRPRCCARDGPKKRMALWEQQTRRSTRRSRSSATATCSGSAPPRKTVQGLQREDRAPALLQRLAGQVARADR